MDPLQQITPETVSLLDSSMGFFVRNMNEFCYGALGLVGSINDIILYRYAKGSMPRGLMVVSMTSGTVLAITGGSLIGSWLGLDITKSGVLGLCAYIAGMWGRKVSEKIFGMQLPDLPKKEAVS